MYKIKEVIVVEGRYDRNTLSQIVDATIVETSGFGIFSDREKLLMLRRFAEKNGLIVLTDSDGAGFVIRNYLKGALGSATVKQAYIPDVFGREKRKIAASKEGKLGVEGMEAGTILEALRRCGATFLDKESTVKNSGITKADLYVMGLSGKPGSATKRKELLKKMELPERLSANAFLDVINALYTRAEIERLIS